MMRTDRWILPSVYVALTAAFCWPIFSQPLAEGTGDWDQHLFYYASVLRNTAYGQLPFWNPWYCGGNVLWQNPQVSLISPVYALAAVMPLPLAMKFNIAGHYLLGFAGMHLLLRRTIGVQSRIVVVYLASLFVFSGAIAIHLEAGHSDFLSMFWLPLILFSFHRAAAGSRRALVAGGAMIAVSILNGGPHIVPLAAALLGALGMGAWLFARTAKPFLLAVALVAAGCALAAPRLVPSWQWLQTAEFHDTRPVKHPDRMSLEMLTHALFDSTQGTHTRLNRTDQLYGWQEYGGYLGWFGGVLAIASALWVLIFRRGREHWWAASSALALFLMLLMTLGEFAPWAPASILHQLPFFSSFRIPSRHILLIPLAGAICMACAARAFESTPRSQALRWLVLALSIIGTVQIGLVNRGYLREVFILPEGGPISRLFDQQTPVAGERDVPRTGAPAGVLYTNMLGSLLTGVSPLDCWEPLQVRKRAALGAMTMHAEGANTSTADHQFTPNRVSARVSVGAEPARLILNQNFSTGWSSDAGPIEPDPQRRRPSVVLPAGFNGTVTFSYAPPGLATGVVVWLLSILGSVVVLLRRR